MIPELDARTRRLVAALDDDVWRRSVMQHALTDTGAAGPAQLHLVTVLPRGTDEDVRRAGEDLLSVALDVIGQLADALEEHPRVWVHVRVGNPADEIVLLARDVEADEILSGPPAGPGGSVAPRLVEIAPCAVRVVRPKDYGTGNRAVCPACVEVRSSSAGERWFCARHSDPRTPRLVSRIPRPNISARPTQFG